MQRYYYQNTCIFKCIGSFLIKEWEREKERDVHRGNLMIL